MHKYAANGVKELGSNYSCVGRSSHDVPPPRGSNDERRRGRKRRGRAGAGGRVHSAPRAKRANARRGRITRSAIVLSLSVLSSVSGAFTRRRVRVGAPPLVLLPQQRLRALHFLRTRVAAAYWGRETELWVSGDIEASLGRWNRSLQWLDNCTEKNSALDEGH